MIGWETWYNALIGENNDRETRPRTVTSPAGVRLVVGGGALRRLPDVPHRGRRARVAVGSRLRHDVRPQPPAVHSLQEVQEGKAGRRREGSQVS